MKTFSIIPIIMGIFLVIGCLGLRESYQNYQDYQAVEAFKARAISTRAEIMSHISCYSRQGASYGFSVEFTTPDGELIYAKTLRQPTEPQGETGDLTEILYDPQHPDEPRLAPVGIPFKKTLVPGAVGVGFVGMVFIYAMAALIRAARTPRKAPSRYTGKPAQPFNTSSSRDKLVARYQKSHGRLNKP
ncbi:DUF3592 domain-containing protein [Desulfoluna spongiiphila]|uniref:DUF3592 domain-containing protein n=1 Tax=Desulfoluna spongiiphila TaxID=419481 RepID=A0A1G5ILZ5_9BACT|nr:DUF3592 domain-containing protein [Desulfoluna spongiiphila]SCY76589.1 hypothetical protein SAMN05216233_12096 [Desulfoluna spongiiphila]